VQNICSQTGLNSEYTGRLCAIQKLIVSFRIADADPWQAAHVFTAIAMADYIAGQKEQQSAMTQIISSVYHNPGFDGDG
jgi:hypothetical protein